jgi:hypothetical protein
MRVAGAARAKAVAASVNQPSPPPRRDECIRLGGVTSLPSRLPSPLRSKQAPTEVARGVWFPAWKRHSSLMPARRVCLSSSPHPSDRRFATGCVHATMARVTCYGAARARFAVWSASVLLLAMACVGCGKSTDVGKRSHSTVTPTTHPQARATPPSQSGRGRVIRPPTGIAEADLVRAVVYQDRLANELWAAAGTAAASSLFDQLAAASAAGPIGRCKDSSKRQILSELTQLRAITKGRHLQLHLPTDPARIHVTRFHPPLALADGFVWKVQDGRWVTARCQLFAKVPSP